MLYIQICLDWFEDSDILILMDLWWDIFAGWFIVFLKVLGVGIAFGIGLWILKLRIKK